jgi:hypothetical protein
MIAYRDKKVVGVFVRFSCTASALIESEILLFFCKSHKGAASKQL